MKYPIEEDRQQLPLFEGLLDKAIEAEQEIRSFDAFKAVFRSTWLTSCFP